MSRPVRERCALIVTALLVGMGAPADARRPSRSDPRKAVVESADALFVGTFADPSPHGIRNWVPMHNRVLSWIHANTERAIARSLAVERFSAPIDVVLEGFSELSISQEKFRLRSSWIGGPPPIDPGITAKRRFEWRAIVGGGGLVAGEAVVAVSRRPMTAEGRPAREDSDYAGYRYQLQLGSFQITHLDAQARKLRAPRPGLLRRALTRIAARLRRGR